MRGLRGGWVNERVLLQVGIYVSQSLKFSESGVKLEAFQLRKWGNTFWWIFENILNISKLYNLGLGLCQVNQAA